MQYIDKIRTLFKTITILHNYLFEQLGTLCVNIKLI